MVRNVSYRYFHEYPSRGAEKTGYMLRVSEAGGRPLVGYNHFEAVSAFFENRRVACALFSASQHLSLGYISLPILSNTCFPFRIEMHTLYLPPVSALPKGITKVACLLFSFSSPKCRPFVQREVLLRFLTTPRADGVVMSFVCDGIYV